MDRPASRFTLRNFSAPFRSGLALGLALVVLDTGLTLLGPFFVKRGIDRGVMQTNEQALWLASLGFLGAAIGDWFATRGYTWVTGRTAERMLLSLRIRIFAHLQRLSLDYYDRELAGRVMTRMTTDVEALSQLVQTGLITAVVSILTCIGVLVWLVILSPPLALAAAAVLPPLILATFWYRRRAAVTYDLARDRISELNADFQESLSGVRIGQAFGQEERNLAVVPRDQRALPRRPVQLAEADRRVLPVRPAARRHRLGDRARHRPGARRTGRRHDGRRDRLHPLPRPVLLPDPAAVAGVRHVAAGGGVDGPDHRADGHADGDAGIPCGRCSRHRSPVA